MMYGFLLHPVFWLFFVGLFLGAAAALVTVRPGRRKDPAKFRRQRPTKVCLSLSAAVVCLSAAFFASSPDGLFPRFFLAALAGLLLAGPGLRFKKAVGIPLLVLSLAALVFGVKALAGWQSAGRTAPAAMILVLGLEETSAALSFTPEGAKETIIRAALQPGSGLGIKIAILRIPAAYPVFGAIPLYRIQALASSGQDYPLPMPAPPAWEKTLLGLPGVRIETREIPLPPLSLFASCEVLFEPRGETLLFINKEP
ncbi:MAG: hypothetical protein LBT33_09435 [Spirochaetia bacterium]|jgi:hypothetical protein|nr:hypothetical protein [Spirochaetia bacterium]